LLYIHANLAPELRGELVSVTAQEDRIISLDLLQPEMGTIQGKRLKFSLYTTPGAVYYSNTRRVVLQEADGVVFVVDSQFDRLEANMENLQDLEQYLRSYGHELAHFPCVIQYNKQDLPNLPPLNILQPRTNRYNFPFFEAIATQGVGVFETLQAILNSVVKRAVERFSTEE
jgi:signal recognition particle receptor subunit beta